MNRIEDIIDKEGFYISTSSGCSMLPFLRDRKDTIIIKRKPIYNKYDVVLYKRNDKYILHRIVKVLDNSYIVRGDNCYYNEYDINDHKIIGYLDECFRGNKKINLNGPIYYLYVRLWICSYPLRYLLYKIRYKR